MSEQVKVTVKEGLTTISFDRAEKKNALTLAMYTAAAEAIDEASAEGRCVVIGSTSEHFTAGNDLMDFMSNPPTGTDSPVYRFLMSLRRCETPVLAAVDGFAIGIGTTLLFHCDLAWAKETAKFKMPFVDLGLVPEAGASTILPAMVGHRKAAELLYFSDFFGADVAEEAGIINGVVDGDVMGFVTQMAHELADKPAEALRLTKGLLRQSDDARVEAAMEAEARLFVERLQSEEFMKVVASFQ